MRAEVDLVVREQFVDTTDGWSLHLRRTRCARQFDPSTQPLLIVPGYGMNSFIFSYHPRGTSMERCLAEAGFEVWALDLRGQGLSEPTGRDPGPQSLLRYASVDLPAAIERVMMGTETNAEGLTLIGCSLGGSIAYGYLALRRDPRVAQLVTMGAPLRWLDVHPLLRVAFSSPTLAGLVRINRTRELVRGLFPLLVRVPALLSLYMNTQTIDLGRMSEMTQTVEDPDPAINRDIARWVNDVDLRLDGVDVTAGLRELDLPLLVVISNRDGIVPVATAESVIDVWGGDDVEKLVVGDDDNWYAHANLFVADDAPQLVFAPLIRWLRQHPPRADDPPSRQIA